MNKSFAYKTIIVGLVSVCVSLVTFLGYTVFPPGGSVVAAALQTPIAIAESPPSLTIVKKGSLELAGDLDADGIIDPGDTIKYTIVYSNTGVVTATNVTIVDDYDETLIASIPNISGEGKDDGETITWDLGLLAPGVGSSVLYESTLRDSFPPGSTPIENTAKIASDGVALASASKAVVVKRPRLTLLKERDLVKDANDDGTPDPGDTLKYTIYYENTGEVRATEVKIVDDYDRDCIVNITNISDEGTDDADTITWDLGDVQPGESGSVSYEGTVGALPLGSHTVANIVTVSSSELPPLTAQASIVVEVAPTPTPQPTPQPALGATRTNVLESMPWLGYGVFGMGGACLVVLLVLFGMPKVIRIKSTDDTSDKTSDDESHQRMRVLQESICVILIAVLIAILRLTNCITEEGTISILSGIIGYVLGRAVTEARGGG